MTSPTLGVVVVTFNAEDVILDCLMSLLAADGVSLEIAIVDNASTDNTVTLLRDWAAGYLTYTPPDDLPFQMDKLQVQPVPFGQRSADGHVVTLIEAKSNSGFAGGVNLGLKYLASLPQIKRFWILNPDSAVPPETPRAFACHATGTTFSLMGGRVLYYDNPDIIQLDGGTVNRWTGVTGNIGVYQVAATTPSPKASDQDFVTGASMVASREFYEAAGPMPENYFLYYEELDWALRRGSMPLAHCPEAIVYHRAGTAIGSPAIGRPASPFSLYFKHRSRLRFVRRHLPWSMPTALAYSVAKSGQLLLKGYGPEAWAILAGSLNLPPPRLVRDRLSTEAAQIAFGP